MRRAGPVIVDHRSWRRSSSANDLAVRSAIVTPSELAPYVRHLRSAVEIFSVLTDPRVAAQPGSEADRELAEASELMLGDGTWD